MKISLILVDAEGRKGLIEVEAEVIQLTPDGFGEAVRVTQVCFCQTRPDGSYYSYTQ